MYGRCIYRNPPVRSLLNLTFVCITEREKDREREFRLLPASSFQFLMHGLLLENLLMKRVKKESV